MNKLGIIASILPLIIGGDGEASPYETFNDEILSLESLASVIGVIEKKELPKFEEEIVYTSIYSNLEKTYRQTYYSVQEGEHSLGAGYNKSSNEVESFDNVMNFYDYEYGYLPIIAVDINEVMKSGKNEKGIWNMYGTVVELSYDNGNIQKAIILDACGACSRADKVDLWVMNNDARHDVQNVELKVIRDGWSYDNNIRYEN